MDVLVLIDKLDDLIHNAKQIPLTENVRVDREEIYDLLDQMRATIPEEIKQARFEKLAAVQMQVRSVRNRTYVGQKLKVIVEGYHPDSPYLMRGRFYGQCPEIDGQVIINDGRLVDAFGKQEAAHQIEEERIADHEQEER